jgi:hypothetical protein
VFDVYGGRDLFLTTYSSRNGAGKLTSEWFLCFDPAAGESLDGHLRINPGRDILVPAAKRPGVASIGWLSLWFSISLLVL